MKRFIILLTALFAFSIFGGFDLAYSQEKKAGKVKTKFYNFDDYLIDGDIKKPTALLTKVKDQVRFQRLLKLKTHFWKEIIDTTKEKSTK